MCGFPKSAHTVAAATARGVELNGHDQPTDLRNRPPAARGGGRAARLAAQRALLDEKMGANAGACDNYRVNMQAANFGECVCGFPKSAHSLLATRKGAERPGASGASSKEQGKSGKSLLPKFAR